MGCFNCENCLNLDDLEICSGSEQSIDVGANWLNASGDEANYTVHWDFNGSPYKRTFTIEDGQPILIPAVLQRSAVVEFYVLDPTGARLSYTVDSVNYDCYRIKLSSIING